KDVVGAMAAAALYKSHMLKEVGLLDESFITLGEDAELSMRSHKFGWKAKFVPESIVYHKRGKSITKRDVINRMTVLSTKNTTENVLRYGTSKEKVFYSFVLIKEGMFVVFGSLLKRNTMKTWDYTKLILKSYKKIICSLFKS
ncbi:MAG: glycosyltransferase family 2 protein, partial [Methanobacterium paludis]|nr:glycosyltransferase family 2 protein [Methanobacterium paludis]